MGLEAVQADDDALAFFDFPLEPVGAGADLLLDEALFNGGHGAAHAVDLVDVVLGPGLDFVGKVFDVIGTRQGVDGVADVGLIGHHLLGAQRHLDRQLGGQGQGLVIGVGVQGLGAAQHGAHGLEGHPHDVVQGLLGRQRAAGGLGVETEHHGLGVLSVEALLHDLGPQAPGGPELGHFLQEVGVGVEEEGEPGTELIHLHARGNGRVDVGDAVGQGKGDFLHRGEAGFPDVVAADADGVPQQYVAMFMSGFSAYVLLLRFRTDRIELDGDIQGITSSYCQ